LEKLLEAVNFFFLAAFFTYKVLWSKESVSSAIIPPSLSQEDWPWDPSAPGDKWAIQRSPEDIGISLEAMENIGIDDAP
jgi:hypothetical protein